MKRYPPKPENAERYQHRYGYEKPVSLGDWRWSCTFGRWGRVVTFADGWTGLTYPEPVVKPRVEPQARLFTGAWH